MEDYIKLKSLSIDELTGVVNLYPWFGAARKELASRMSDMGGDQWGKCQFSDAAMYIVDRRMIADMMRNSAGLSCTDENISELLRRYIAPDAGDTADVGSGTEVGKGNARVPGGDYFTQSEYEAVKKSDDCVFSKFAAKAKSEMTPEELKRHEELDLYTETLAQIYAEQGYYQQAEHIYSKLRLAYPEKNAYFAALIEKLKESN